MDFRFFLALTGLLAVNPQAGWTQSVDISGTVRDSLSGEPLPGVVISLAGRGLLDTTDANGEFRLVNSEAEANRRTPLLRLSFSTDSGFALRLRREEDVVAEVLNGAGRTIARAGYALDSGDWVLRPRNLPTGLYTVKLWTGSRLRALRMNIHNDPKPEPGAPIGWVLERMKDGVAAPAFARRGGNPVDSLRAIWKGQVRAMVPVESWSQNGLRVYPGPDRTASADAALGRPPMPLTGEAGNPPGHAGSPPDPAAQGAEAPTPEADPNPVFGPDNGSESLADPIP